MRLGPLDHVLMLCPDLNHAADSYCLALAQVVVARSHLDATLALQLGAANLAGRNCVALASALGQKPWLWLIENRDARAHAEPRSGWLGLELGLDLAELKLGTASGFTRHNSSAFGSRPDSGVWQLLGPANEVLWLRQRDPASQAEPALVGAVLACPEPQLTRSFYRGLGGLDTEVAEHALALRGAHNLTFVPCGPAPCVELAAVDACGIAAVAFARSNSASERLDERYQWAVPQHLRGHAGELVILL